MSQYPESVTKDIYFLSQHSNSIEKFNFE